MTRGLGGKGPANIMKHLKHIAFPADKNKILAYAKNGPGPDTRKVLEMLSQISEKTYRSPSEIVREVHRIECDAAKTR